MPAQTVPGLDVQFSHDLVQYWGWFLAFGIGLLALGVIAVARGDGDCRLNAVFRLAARAGQPD